MRNILETPPAMSRAVSRVILKARQVGRSYYHWTAQIAYHLEKHGEPWSIRMTAPAHAARTALAKLVSQLEFPPACAGTCNQGRRACDCRNPT